MKSFARCRLLFFMSVSICISCMFSSDVCAAPAFFDSTWQGDDQEDADIYYDGSVQTVCEQTDPQTETLITNKAYCEAYPKDCIGNQVVCFDGNPMNAYHSKAWENIYKKKLSSYKQNQKTVCHDFPWTCPPVTKADQLLIQAETDLTDITEVPEIISRLPKNASLCDDDTECKENEICTYYDYIKTGPITICKSIDNVKCHSDLECPYDLFCNHGKCIECIDNDWKVKRPGMKCVKNKWIPDDTSFRIPCSGEYKGGCPSDYVRENAIKSDGSELCSCRYSSSTQQESYAHNNTCKSNMDCQPSETCYPFYSKCLSNDEDFGNSSFFFSADTDYYFSEIMDLPLALMNTRLNDLNKKKTQYEEKLDNLQNKSVKSLDLIREYTRKIEYLEMAIDAADSASQKKNLIQELNQNLNPKKKSKTNRKIAEPEDRMPYYWDDDRSSWSDDDLTQPDDDDELLPKETVYYYLGLIYLKGRSRDLKKAFSYIKKAADSGQKEAQLVIGLMYIHGQGTAMNENKGFWYLNRVFKPEPNAKTSVLAHTCALIELIKCYHYGIGTPKDKEKADEINRILLNISHYNAGDIRDFYEATSIDRFSEFELLSEMPDDDEAPATD